MSYNVARQKESGAAASFASTGDKLTFTPAVAVEILEFGYVVTTAVSDAATGVAMSLDKRITAGSDTGRVEDAGGTITIATAALANAAGLAGSVLRGRPASRLELYPGEEVILEVTDAPSVAGSGVPFVVFRELPRGDRSVDNVYAS